MDNFGYIEKPKQWHYCLKCGHVHVPILVNNMIRWAAVNGRYTRTLKKHGLSTPKPCLHPIQHYAHGKINYKKLKKTLNQYHTELIPLGRTISDRFILLYPEGQRAKPLGVTMQYIKTNVGRLEVIELNNSFRDKVKRLIPFIYSHIVNQMYNYICRIYSNIYYKSYSYICRIYSY